MFCIAYDIQVNSDELGCASPGSSMASWNFATPTNEEPSLNAVPAHDLSQYSINNPSQMALSTGRSTYRSPIYNETFARTPSLNVAVGPPRNFQTIPHQTALGSDSYHVQQAQNGLQYHHNVTSPTAYALQEISPNWVPSSVCGISSMGTPFAQNNPMEYDSLQYQGSAYAEEPPYFPALSPLSTHLPASTSLNGRERCLPAPVQAYLAPASQYTPETESYNSSSGGTESSSEVSMYECTSLGSNALVGVPMSLPNLRGPRDTQCYAPLPTLDPYPAQRQEYHYLANSVDTNQAADSRPPELMAPRGYRLLQPQPRRSSRSFLDNSCVAATRESKKSAAVRRQERQNVLRHQ